MVKEEFKDIELHDEGGLNLKVIQDTQSLRKIDFGGYKRVFFLIFGFKDGILADNVFIHGLEVKGIFK